MNSQNWILLFLIFPLIAFGRTELTILEDSPQQLYRPKIGPMLSMNFLTMDYYKYQSFNDEVRRLYPEKYRGYSFGVMADIPIRKHEHIASILTEVSFDYMPTFDIDVINLDEKRTFVIKNEFSHFNISLNGGALIRVMETGLKFGAGVGLNFMYAQKQSFVNLDSVTRKEIEEKNIQVIRYLPDKQTAEIINKYEYSPNFLRIPVFVIFGYEFQGNKFSIFPFFRFNYSIFAQASYRQLDYTVSAYQVGATLMVPIKK